jgi:hypothetical protein
MHLPWLAQQYERTCAECGGAWRVPRYFARGRVQSIFSFFLGSSPRGGFDQAEFDREVQSSVEIAEQAESFRKCPECGSEHYSQHPVRS